MLKVIIVGALIIIGIVVGIIAGVYLAIRYLCSDDFWKHMN